MKVRALLLSLMWFMPLFSYAAGEVRFLAIADIHFDPFIACYEIKQKPCPLITKLQAASVDQWNAILSENDRTPPRYRLDTNYPILATTLVEAKAVAKDEHVDFVLVLGDLLAHNYRSYYKKYAQDKSRAHYEVFVKKTLTFLAQAIAEAFPGISTYMVVGNNDSYRGDYFSDPNGVFFSDMAATWSPLIKDTEGRATMQHRFPVAGYYAVTLPQQENLRLIVLNSVLFSSKARGRDVHAAAEAELRWLQHELSLAKTHHQQVLVATHIPKSVDIYLFSHIHLFNLMQLWQVTYMQKFDALVQQYSNEIAGVFSGHLHSNGLQYIDGVPFVGVPAISPIFGNKPTFKVYTFSTEDDRFVYDDDPMTVELDFSSFVH